MALLLIASLHLLQNNYLLAIVRLLPEVLGRLPLLHLRVHSLLLANRLLELALNSLPSLSTFLFWLLCLVLAVFYFSGGCWRVSNDFGHNLKLILVVALSRLRHRGWLDYVVHSLYLLDVVLVNLVSGCGLVLN